MNAGHGCLDGVKLGVADLVVLLYRAWLQVATAAAGHYRSLTLEQTISKV